MLCSCVNHVKEQYKDSQTKRLTGQQQSPPQHVLFATAGCSSKQRDGIRQLVFEHIAQLCLLQPTLKQVIKKGHQAQACTQERSNYTRTTHGTAHG